MNLKLKEKFRVRLTRQFEKDAAKKRGASQLRRYTPKAGKLLPSKLDSALTQHPQRLYRRSEQGTIT
ncbi:MAG: hypothetical protein WAW75_01260, partial [Gallionella sp.]